MPTFCDVEGAPLKPATASRHVDRLVEQSGLPHLTLHGLRHSWASLALLADVPTKVVSEVLGHSSTQITADVPADDVAPSAAIEPGDGVVGLDSQKGAPGVTLTSLLLAAAWPSTPGRRKLLLEADPSGGSLALRYRLGLETSLITLAVAARALLDTTTQTKTTLWSQRSITVNHENLQGLGGCFSSSTLPRRFSLLADHRPNNVHGQYT